ncbi:MAG: carbon starvation protein A [Candidatus Margulisbacteria bacterium]|jgi:carbon starvation protein|nr:carbon starvation protein A [Candidatus Margulisiibacteriota bacterium]
MNALVLLIIALCVFALAYRYYAAFLAAKVLVLDTKKETPAHRLKDGHDYHPTNKWVLFGHHFAAIAGAGPLIGPVLAAQFGFLPGAIWIIIGAVLAGAVHDYVILFASVRHNGLSLHKIARDYISVRTGVATAIAVLFIIITALAGLSIVVVNALAESAWGTFAIIVSIPAALLVGFYMYVLRKGQIVEASVIGTVLLLGGVFFGYFIQNSPAAVYFTFSRQQLSLALPVYGFIASVLPVWMLLCPRDYLSSYLKIGTVALLALGVFFVAPEIKMPAVTPFIFGGGPIIPGRVWPFVCITIACGAISGFHSLISSGTTPKMVSNEKEIKLIGYGAMLVEGFVALMALIAATALFPADYFAINCSPEVFKQLGMQVVNLPVLSQLVQEEIAGRPGGAVSLAVGMAQIFAGLPGMKGLMGYWYHFVIMFEALFILTTVDTGTRVARYITQEIVGKVSKPFGDQKWLPGIALTSFLVVFAWGYLVYNGDIATIWPMFGVANQLLATAALTIGTAVILKHGKKRRYALITLLPMLFMLVTTLAASLENIFYNYLPKGTFNGNLNAALSAIMLVLVIVIVADSLAEWARHPRFRAGGREKDPYLELDI